MRFGIYGLPTHISAEMEGKMDIRYRDRSLRLGLIFHFHPPERRGGIQSLVGHALALAISFLPPKDARLTEWFFPAHHYSIPISI
jgi:hypothetical protein